VSTLVQSTRAELRAYLEHRIAGVMDWYAGPKSGAIDCRETRESINRDLASIKLDAERKFHVKIDRVLRVRSAPREPGTFVVRFEHPDLC
jgi:hypothetical protein